jgi:DNA-binding MarR family transcriptional regulator
MLEIKRESEIKQPIVRMGGGQKRGEAELIEDIIQLQRQVNRALRHGESDVLMELSLTIAQLKSLFFISNEGNTNFTKLAQALRVTPSNVTGIVDRLVGQGLVSRRENPQNRRMLLLQPTDKGETLLASLRERRVSQMAEVLGRLSLGELSVLARGLALLAKAAEVGKGEDKGEHD